MWYPSSTTGILSNVECYWVQWRVIGYIHGTSPTVKLSSVEYSGYPPSATNPYSSSIPINHKSTLVKIFHWWLFSLPRCLWWLWLNSPQSLEMTKLRILMLRMEIFSEHIIESSGYPQALNPQPLFLLLTHTPLIPAQLKTLKWRSGQRGRWWSCPWSFWSISKLAFVTWHLCHCKVQYPHKQKFAALTVTGSDIRIQQPNLKSKNF